jgi:hypothetical protein
MRESHAANLGTSIRTTKCEGELEKRYSSAPTGAKAAIHDPDVGIGAAELCICDDETDSPICHAAKDYQENQPHDEPSAIHGVW